MKEGKDLYRKLSNGKLRKMYGGIVGGIGDSVKDMKIISTVQAMG